jgi:hypothetical protein
LLECWIAGLLDCRVAGLPGCWIAGLLDCRVAGLLACWLAGCPVQFRTINIVGRKSIFPLHLHPNFDSTMILRISRGFWLISVLSALAALLFVYAALPEVVFLSKGELSVNSVSREMMFYVSLGFLTLVNAMVFAVAAVYKKQEDLRAWFNGLVVTLNIFFIVALFFINSSNSNEKFDYTRIGFTIYGSVGLFVVWAISWPIILVFRKILAKPGI